MEGFWNNTDTLKEETYLRKTIITDLSEISEELPKFSEKEKIDLAVSL